MFEELNIISNKRYFHYLNSLIENQCINASVQQDTTELIKVYANSASNGMGFVLISTGGKGQLSL